MNKSLHTTCCIVGGGPAGMMTGFLLARAGVEVIVLEKHADFFRDFRGDTIHPSTIEIMSELGLLKQFLAVPHQEIEHLHVVYNNTEFEIGDFTHLKVVRPVLGIMPQWDFLNFVARQALRYKGFHLVMESEVRELIVENNRVVGVRANTPDGVLEVRANLVIGTDGRSSTVREQAKLKVLPTGVPIDVLWFRFSKRDGDPPQTLGRFYYGSIMILIDRTDYWQCGFVIEKNGLDKIKAGGLDAFRKQLLEVSPFLENRVDELKDWNDIKLLSVAIDHLEKWYCDGLLCIGDAAHAMSPVGGVGINLAIQDAVATANILYGYLRAGKTMDGEILKLVQQRRALPTKVIQTIQATIHKGIAASRASSVGTPSKLPLPFRLLKMFPVLRRIPAYIVGIGVRSEHIKSPDFAELIEQQ